MADEFQMGSGNWWESSARNRYESPVGSTTASTSSLNNNNNSGSSMGGNFGWPTEIVDIKARSSMDSVSVSGSSMVFPSDSQKLQPHVSSAVSGGGSAATGLLPDPNLQMMGLGLSSPTMDWNQALL